MPDHNERSFLSPYDVTVGCVTTPYGLEYHGGLVRVTADENLERSIQMVMGSAARSRGTIFVSRDEDDPATMAFEVEGERSVSCKDVADALRRVFTSLSSVQSPSSVELFLSRLVHLNAVGCVDFSLLDANSLQMVVAGIARSFAALKEQNYFLLQEWLRYPLKTNFRKTDTQLERSTLSSTALRASIGKMRKHNSYLGLVVIGLASENSPIASRSVGADTTAPSEPQGSGGTHTLSEKVPNHGIDNSAMLQAVSRSIFDLLSLPHHRPLLDLGVLLALQGYVFGIEIQTVCQTSMAHLVTKFGKDNPLIRHMCASSNVRYLAHEAGQALLVRLVTEDDKLSGQSKVARRLLLEIEMFVSCQWEMVLLSGTDHGINMSALRHIMFMHFQELIDRLSHRHRKHE